MSADKCPKCGANEHQPVAATVLDWLRSNLGGHALAPLTGSDVRALRASVQIAEQYGYDRSREVLFAWGMVVKRMQPKCRELAYHAVAHALDWSTRAEVWYGAELEHFTPSLKCSFEPGGSKVDLAEEREEMSR